MELEAALAADLLGKRQPATVVIYLLPWLERYNRERPDDLDLTARLLNLYISRRIDRPAEQLLTHTLDQHDLTPRLTRRVILPAACAWIDATQPSRARQALSLLPHRFCASYAQWQTVELRLRQAQTRLDETEAVYQRLCQAAREEDIPQALALWAEVDRMRTRWPTPQERLAWPAVERYGQVLYYRRPGFG